METVAPQSAGWVNFLGWIETNKQRLVRVVIGLGVFAALLMIWFWYRGYREISASEALSSVRQPYGNEVPQPGITEELMALADKYSGTRAGGRALLSAGRNLFLEGKYAPSQAAFERFLKEYPDSTWVSQARFSAAAAVDAQGKSTDAIGLYSAYLSALPNDPFVSDARWNLGRLYEGAGKFSEALAQYEKLTAVNPGEPNSMNSLAGLARERTFQVYQLHPELRPVPTNLPPQASRSITPAPTAIPISVKPGGTGAVPIAITPAGTPAVKPLPTTPAPTVTPTPTTPAPTVTPTPTAKPQTPPANPAVTPPTAKPTPTAPTSPEKK